MCYMQKQKGECKNATNKTVMQRPVSPCIVDHDRFDYDAGIC